jgi:hypothetical protein
MLQVHNPRAEDPKRRMAKAQSLPLDGSSKGIKRKDSSIAVMACRNRR